MLVTRVKLPRLMSNPWSSLVTPTRLMLATTGLPLPLEMDTVENVATVELSLTVCPATVPVISGEIVTV